MDYSTDTTTSGSAGDAIYWTVIAVYVLAAVLIIASMWILYRKANKPGWAAVVPFYKTVVMMEVIGRPTWWFLIIAFVPIVTIWFGIVAALDFAKSYGKSTGFGILLILLPIVGYPLLAFDKNTKYVGPAAEDLDGFTPAPNRSGPTLGLPTNAFTAPPAFVPPVPMPATSEPVMPSAPPVMAEPVASVTPPPGVPGQSAAPEASAQPPVDELVAANLPDVEEPAPAVVSPVEPNGAPAVEPPVVPEAPESSSASNTPTEPSGDTGQPTPPQL